MPRLAANTIKEVDTGSDVSESGELIRLRMYKIVMHLIRPCIALLQSC